MKNQQAMRAGRPRSQSEHRGWHSRGYLPHFDSQELVQMVTFRLADSLPREKIETWKADPRCKNERILRNVIENYLDKGYGSCFLRGLDAAKKVENALLHFDGVRYRMLSWCIMPNHVHTLFEVMQIPLSEILHSWKSFTGHQLKRNAAFGTEVWQADYFDRFIRNETHLMRAVHYIEQNPVKAKLCNSAPEWRFSSAFRRSAGVSPTCFD